MASYDGHPEDDLLRLAEVAEELFARGKEWIQILGEQIGIFPDSAPFLFACIAAADKMAMVALQERSLVSKMLLSKEIPDDPEQYRVHAQRLIDAVRAAEKKVVGAAH